MDELWSEATLDLYLLLYGNILVSPLASDVTITALTPNPAATDAVLLLTCWHVGFAVTPRVITATSLLPALPLSRATDLHVVFDDAD